jgi:hypothetical protein
MVYMPEEYTTDEQKLAAFEKWQANRAVRKVNSGAKRTAQKALKAKYGTEFDKLTKTVVVASKGKAPEVLTQAEKAAKWDALQAKKSGRQGKSATNRAAMEALKKAHSAEYDTLVKATAPAKKK